MLTLSLTLEQKFKHLENSNLVQEMAQVMMKAY